MVDKRTPDNGRQKMNTKTELKKITSHNTAENFFWWIAENTEYNHIQGYELERFDDDGRVIRLTAGSVIHPFDHDYIWNERKMINDWITRIQENTEIELEEI